MKKQYSVPAIKVRTVECAAQILSASSSSVEAKTSGLDNAPVWGGVSTGSMSAGAKGSIWEDANDDFSE